MRTLAHRLALALVAAAALLPPHGVCAETTVRWVTTLPPSGLDPHVFSNNQTHAVTNQVFEGLLLEDWQPSYHPGLALSWSLETPTVWRFELRQGVTFHDGTPLTADDVVFSFTRAAGDLSSSADALLNVVEVQAPDARTLRVTTRTPDLIFPFRIEPVQIISRHWAEQHGQLTPTPSDPIASADPAWGDAGTGPYRVESFEAGARTVLTKYAGWWGLGTYPAAVDRFEQTIVASPEEAVDRMARGDADFYATFQLAPTDQARLGQISGVRVVRGETCLASYLGFDLAHPELRTATVKGRNPFKDRRVREAIYQAIDIEALRDALGGLAAPAGMILGRTANGWTEALDRRLPYDPEGARRLLAEAGYGEGFGVALDAAEAGTGPIYPPLQAMLARVGITVEVRLRPVGEMDRMILAQETDFFRWGWCEIDDSSWVFRAIYHSGSPYAAPGVASPELDELIDAIDSETATYLRDERIEQLWQRVLGDILYVPLYRRLQLWAMRTPFDLPMGPGPNPRFRSARLTE